MTTNVPRRSLVARRMPKLTSQVDPPATRWSRGTVSVMHSNSLSSGHGFFPLNDHPPATGDGAGVGEDAAGGLALGDSDGVDGPGGDGVVPTTGAVGATGHALGVGAGEQAPTMSPTMAITMAMDRPGVRMTGLYAVAATGTQDVAPGAASPRPSAAGPGRGRGPTTSRAAARTSLP